MHIYNLNVGKDGMSRWRLKNIGEKPVSLKNERTFDFFKKLTKNLKRNAKTIFSTTMVDLLPICFCVTLIFFKKNANTCYLIVYTKFNHWSNIRIFTNSLVQPQACNGFVFIRTESRHISASLNPN